MTNKELQNELANFPDDEQVVAAVTWFDDDGGHIVSTGNVTIGRMLGKYRPLSDKHPEKKYVIGVRFHKDRYTTDDEVSFDV